MIQSFSADCSVKVPVYLSYNEKGAKKRRTKTKPDISFKDALFRGFVVFKILFIHGYQEVSLDHLRKADHSKERQMNFATEIGDQEPSHINEIIRTEVLKEIYLAIQNLPEQCSKIVSMSYIEGFKNEEIAEKMGLSVQTIKNQKTRGLSILRTKLSSEHFMVFVWLSHQLLG